MKPDNYERNHALAAEYVVGTLQGAARRRFERWMMVSARVRRQVWYWERRLQPFNESLPEEAAPSAVWNSIEQRLFPGTAPVAARWWQTLTAWRWSTGIAVLAVFALLLWTPSPPVVTHYVGVVQSQQAEPLWLVNASADHRLSVKAMPPVQPADGGRDYQLWLLPESGAPISLALLPTGGAQLQITLSDQQVRQLLQSRSLAISLEPEGGSPTGQPTGPVVYQTRLVQM
ncbi:MAG: anti-sigma factor [Alcanivorax sp.]|uniref:anti-sigma factor n=1 Tax=Alcanivorax sp. TaxID=1872427 RepID=UPI003DA76AA4